MLTNGKYLVVKEVGLYSEIYGHLKIPEDKIVEINYSEATCDNIKFPASILDGCDDYFKQIPYDVDKSDYSSNGKINRASMSRKRYRIEIEAKLSENDLAIVRAALRNTTLKHTIIELE